VDGPVDHFRDGKDRIYASFNRTTTDKVGFGAPEVYPAFTAKSPTSSMQLNTNWTRIMSSNVVNEMSFGWARPWGELENPHADIPGISITGIQGYQVGWGPNIFVQNNFMWSDVVSWTRGAHSMKLGGGYTLERADNDSARAITRPTFSFNNAFDFANDAPFSESQIPLDPRTGSAPDSIKRYHRTQSFNLFVQDEWKPRRNLTISAGLRFEYFMNITDVSDNTVTNIEFPVDTGNLQSDLASARMVQREWYLSGGVFGPQHTIAPRISFAWDPKNDGRMSVRGGFGRFYDRMSNQIWDSEHQNLPGYANASVTVLQPVKPLFALGSNSVLPYGFPFPAGLTAGVRPNGGLLNGTASVVAADSNTPTEHLDNWFLGVQHALGKYVVVEANYIGSRGSDMYYRWDSTALPAICSTAGSTASCRGSQRSTTCRRWTRVTTTGPTSRCASSAATSTSAPPTHSARPSTTRARSRAPSGRTHTARTTRTRGRRTSTSGTSWRFRSTGTCRARLRAWRARCSGDGRSRV
jgi:hypothetical protein